MRRFAIFAALGAALTACPQPTPVESFCSRAEECNDLPAGVSHQDCVDVFDKCVNNLTTSERNDWERMIDDCVSDDSCQLFANCYAQVPWC